MKKNVTVIIEKTPDGNFDCYTLEDFEKFGLAGYGKTAEEAKNDFWSAYEDMKELEESEGRIMPELNVVYKYDMQSFFDYFSFLNISKIAERAGINPSLMRQYSNGLVKAGEKQYKKLSNTIEVISKELAAATF